MSTVALHVCLSDEQVCALVAGEIDAPQQAQLTDHLDGCEACRTLVVEASRTFSGGEETEAEDRYEVIAELGRGGMGVVYRAHDRVLQRDVALKLIRRELAYDAATRKRLIRESKVMARLRHPNVAQVYDVGAIDGQLYLAMELVEGTTLRRWLSQERTTQEILACFAGAGTGLAAAHAEGLVHRDFKPDNVLVDATGRPQVTDFGLARAADRVEEHLDAEPGGDQAAVDDVTNTSRLAGTPMYMAPEQLDGRPIDPRADIFTFCVSLWEALHGERPFPQTSLGERRRAIAAGPGRAPGGRRVSRRIRRALLAGLADDPAHRPASMHALLVELAPRKRRWPWLVVSSAVVVGVVGASLDRPSPAPPPCPAFEIASSWLARTAEVRQAVARANPGHSDLAWASARLDVDRAIATLERAYAQTCTADASGGEAAVALRACLAEQGAKLSAMVTIAADGGETRALRAAGRINPRRCQETPVAALVRSFGTGRTDVDDAVTRLDALRASGDNEATRAEADVLLARADLDPRQRARTLYNHAHAVNAGGDLEGMEADMVLAYELATDAGLQRLAVLVATETAFAHTLAMGEVAATRWLALAEEVVEAEAPGPWHDHMEAQFLSVRGNVERAAGRNEQAHRDLTRALRLAVDRNPERMGNILLDLVSVDVRLGRLEDALLRIQELQQWGETSWGEYSPSSIQPQFMHGFILEKLGRAREGLVVYRAGLDRARKVNNERMVRAGLLAIANVTTNIGTSEEIAAAMAETEAVFAEAPPAGFEARMLLGVRCRAAVARADAHRFEACDAAFQDALSHPEVPDSMLSVIGIVVDLSLARNDPGQALKDVEAVRTHVRAVFGEDHTEPVLVLALAHALIGNDRAPEAAQQLQRLLHVSMGPSNSAEAAFLRACTQGPTPQGLADAQAAREFWFAHAVEYKLELAEVDAWLELARADSQPQASPSDSHSQPQK